MGLLGDIYNTVVNTANTVSSWGKGAVDDIRSWANNLVADVGAAVSSSFSGDVVGINANKIPDMIASIEDYIGRINAHLDQIKEETSTANAMQGEYAEATKVYVQTACDVCYRIVTQLRFFEDKLVAVQQAYTKKDQNMASTINTAGSELNSTWTEYQRQN